MKKITDKEFADFLSNKPLYYKIKVVEDYTGSAENSFIYSQYFVEKPFKFLCPKESEVQTFKTGYSYDYSDPFFGSTTAYPNEPPRTFNKETKKLDLTIHLCGVCQSCMHKIAISLYVFSDKSWDERKNGLNIYVQKIGQFPPYEIGLNNTLKKYLSEEDQSNYKKALVCMSTSYGIGAYAYLRRVIENEIKRIIKDISELEFDGVENVKTAFNSFQKDFQMSKVIDAINKHLPSSLKELGDNPIRLLYEQLSGGIHEFTDEQCMEKAHSIDVLLNYVIKKINEEKFHLNDVKEAMKNLRK